MSCLVLTKEIKELASKFPNETEASILTLVELWQEENNKSIEDVPTKEELTSYINKERSSNQKSERIVEDSSLNNDDGINSSSSIISSLDKRRAIDFTFDPVTRRNRVSLLSRLFSNKITSLMEEARLNVQSKIDNPEFTDEEKEQLADTLKKIDRMYIIREYGPAGIFNKIKEDFIDYVESDEETRISLELDAINNTKGAEKYSEEIRRNTATRRASYKFQEFQKIVDYFELLAEEASVSLSLTEKIKINLESEYTPKITTPEKVIDNDTIFDDDSFEDAEETVKDGWMTNYREVSSHDSLSLEVRKVINNIPRLDYKGKYEKDDLGNNVYLDPNYVHAVLIDKLRNMVTASDMLPLLKELAKTKLWVKQVINTLEQDEVLFSKFYQDFRKDFTQYWIQKRIPNSDGTFRVQTISLNQPEGIYYLLDSWRDNYESGTILTKDSIYNNKGEIKTNKANIGLEETVRLINLFQNKDTESMLKALEDEETFNSIVTLLHMIGADVNQSTLRTALTTVKDNEFVKYTHPVLLLLNNLNIIFSGVVANKIETTVDDNGVIKKGDLINTFGSAYNNIANMLAEVTEDAIESSIRENGKSYYAHNTPAYLGKLIKNLKNVSGNKERFMRYIQEEFKQYEWFFRGGKWNNGWLELLESNPEYRKMLDHKVVLNYDKREYTDWDSLDYTLILLNEYWSDPGKTKDTAWYHLPILSDAPSAEFIKFRRYSDRNIDEYDDSGKKLTYQDVLLEKFASLVSQEYSRIMLVRKRDALIQETKDPSIALANYDIKRDSKTGEIVNIGGAEFKFLPQLNTLRDENGVLFLDKLLQLARDKKSLEVKEFIKTSLQTIMDESFEEEYAKWDSMGMFEELPNGKMKHIPFSGQASKVSNIIKALNEARNIMGESFTKDMFSLLDAYSNGKSVKDKDALEVFSSIKSVITEKLVRKEITNEQFQSINSKLKLNNPAKEALREYYWNSKYATSQIIQLTTTDLAFYSSMEDFQKRFKEVHTPSLRLNTKSKYGREFERTIYLKDDEIVSNVANHIEELILDRYNNGELSAFEAASIISKYGISNFKDSKGKEYYKIGDTMVKTSHINVADAQAYRSLSSYRAILDMSGQWTDEMDTAYNNITSGNWTYNDFSVLWQPKKPFVYTQVNNNSGIEGRSGIKTPVQHKNAEFLLLAMYDAIAGATGQSSKLKALNTFMEKHQIDVVQFESTTKVGKQGVLNINDLNDEKEIINFLETATGIAVGKENPNFIHTISYEDYGISTATPEHFIDAIQSVGTQIRKLITADISDDAIIDVGGVKKTKQEWLDLYNRVVTENIIQSFVEVDEIFKNTKEIEKVIKEEIRNNPKYGAEMLKACSLNKDGLFNIPLHDPVQSQMVQQLLTSIIKNRITKQKTKGGSLIQVSSYGLSDKLNIVFEGKGKNKRIKYFECYMPAYSKKFFEHLIDENGQLDVSKLHDDLRKLIGYRIPTEDKYSMVPLYIKGFLPPQSGSAIMLPAEITTISGSDFDVDKLYIIAPEFRVVEYDYDSARKDYARMGELVSDLFSNFNQGEHSFGDLSEIEDESFNNWFKENKEKYRLQKPTFRKVKYNHNKEAKNNSREARNNLILDAMWGVLTNPDTATKILNPGGFDKQKRAARICAILEGMSKKQLIDILNTEYGFKLKYTDSVAKAILSLDYDALDKIKRRLASSIDPLAPSTQVMFHQYNTGGGKMIGVYANHNASHAFIQHTNLSIHPENGGFTYNGEKKLSLHEI